MLKGSGLFIIALQLMQSYSWDIQGKKKIAKWQRNDTILGESLHKAQWIQTHGSYLHRHKNTSMPLLPASCANLAVTSFSCLSAFFPEEVQNVRSLNEKADTYFTMSTSSTALIESQTLPLTAFLHTQRHPAQSVKQSWCCNFYSFTSLLCFDTVSWIISTWGKKS